jgi:hypothetical protein
MYPDGDLCVFRGGQEIPGRWGYGTCTRLTPVIILNSSPKMWFPEPIPPDAMLNGIDHLVPFRHDQRGLAALVRAAEPSPVIERLAQLLVADAVVLVYLHRHAATYFFGCEKLANGIVGIAKDRKAEDAYTRHTKINLSCLKEVAPRLGVTFPVDELQYIFADKKSDPPVPLRSAPQPG